MKMENPVYFGGNPSMQNLHGLELATIVEGRNFLGGKTGVVQRKRLRGGTTYQTHNIPVVNEKEGEIYAMNIGVQVVKGVIKSVQSFTSSSKLTDEKQVVYYQKMLRGIL
ncbi:hypothetical protein HN903_04155 [archaeon]|jgi:hypothetical protein|nr:hypothetical protein [archaeon]MBT7128923.1 hypothetical protein [archaeon]